MGVVDPESRHRANALGIAWPSKRHVDGCRGSVWADVDVWLEVVGGWDAKIGCG